MSATEKIHAAALELEEEGKRPTLTAIRERLGGGSFSTIVKAMKSYPGNTAPTKHFDYDMPPAIRERIDLAISGIWEAAKIEAERRLEGERKALHEAKAEALAEAAEATEALNQLELELEAAKAEAKAERGKREALEKENFSLMARFTDAKETLNQIIAQIHTPASTNSKPRTRKAPAKTND